MCVQLPITTCRGIIVPLNAAGSREQRNKKKLARAPPTTNFSRPAKIKKTKKKTLSFLLLASCTHGVGRAYPCLYSTLRRFWKGSCVSKTCVVAFKVGRAVGVSYTVCSERHLSLFLSPLSSPERCQRDGTAAFHATLCLAFAPEHLALGAGLH
jgi:hypothetical protein